MRRGEKDPIGAHNERMRLAGNTFNALALATFGLAVLRPLIDLDQGFATGAIAFIAVALVLHGVAYYIVSQVEREVS